jgi:hypothetical protein
VNAIAAPGVLPFTTIILPTPLSSPEVHICALSVRIESTRPSTELFRSECNITRSSRSNSS